MKLHFYEYGLQEKYLVFFLLYVRLFLQENIEQKNEMVLNVYVLIKISLFFLENSLLCLALVLEHYLHNKEKKIHDSKEH